MIVFIDTETTGKLDFKRSIHEPFQPRIVQLAAMMTDINGVEAARMNRLIVPDEWDIPAEASAVHGFTTKMCQEQGIPIVDALGELETMLSQSAAAVAHNVQFDESMLSREYRLAKFVDRPFAGKQVFCTMLESTNLCKIPGKWGNYKWPSLAEAHKKLVGRDVVEAHDAMGDVISCRNIFFAIPELVALVDR